MAVEINAAAPATQHYGRGPAQQTALVRIVDTQSGDVFERLPVDAREILAAGNGRYLIEGEPVTPVHDAGVTGDGEKLSPLPKIAHLAAAVTTLDADAVRAMQARDSRANAAPIYAARLAELEPPPPAPGAGGPPAS